MATYEIWTAGVPATPSNNPTHTIDAEKMSIEVGTIAFRDAENKITGIIVLSPGIVVKKVK